MLSPRYASPSSSLRRSPTWRCISLIRARDLGIVRALEVPLRGLWLPVLEVRHVDVHHAVQQLQALGRVVRARVVDDGKPEPTLRGNEQRLEHLRHDVLGRHEVDVVTATGLKLEHHAGEPLGRRPPYLGDLGGLADVVVLAEDTTQVAVTEEDRSGAVPAAEAVLLAEVWEVAADHRVAAGLAERVPIREPIDVAIPGADPAGAERFERPLDTPGQLAAPVQREIGGFPPGSRGHGGRDA